MHKGIGKGFVLLTSYVGEFLYLYVGRRVLHDLIALHAIASDIFT